MYLLYSVQTDDPPRQLFVASSNPNGLSKCITNERELRLYDLSWVSTKETVVVYCPVPKCNTPSLHALTPFMNVPIVYQCEVPPALMTRFEFGHVNAAHAIMVRRRTRLATATVSITLPKHEGKYLLHMSRKHLHEILPSHSRYNYVPRNSNTVGTSTPQPSAAAELAKALMLSNIVAEAVMRRRSVALEAKVDSMKGYCAWVLDRLTRTLWSL